MFLREIRMDNLRVMWADYKIEEERRYQMSNQREKVEMHFRLQGSSNMNDGSLDLFMHSNQQSLFYQQSNLDIEHTLLPGNENAFFEVEFPRPVFDAMVTADCPFLYDFSRQLTPGLTSFWPGFSMTITPQMHSLIREMTSTSYTGHMKRLFLEAKTIELFLLQATGFDQFRFTALPPLQLKHHDIACLHAAKAYLDEHYGDHCSIMALAAQVGINQKKLKQGFKALFGFTVFGYLSHVRMEKARQLLLDEKKTIGEVAGIVGYQHPQHFTAAFRKKYGVLPKYLKD